MCELLITHGAEVNITGKAYNPPLVSAIQYGLIEICTLLLDHGADVNAIGSYHPAGIHAYTKPNKPLIIAIRGHIIERGTPLLYATNKGLEKICESLIERGGIQELDLALFVAARKGNLELCTLFIKHGANVDGKTSPDIPLVAAAKEGRRKVCLLLLEKGASRDLDIALYRAAEMGYTRICAPLIEKGANVNITIMHPFQYDTNTFQRDTPLLRAANNNCLSVCELLVENGANVNAEDGFNKTALIHAAQNNAFKLCKLLIQHGAKKGINKALSIAIYKGNSDICLYLIERGATANAKDRNNNSIFLRISRKPEICKILITNTIFLPKLDNLIEAYRRIKTALLCFKRLASTLKPNFPKNIPYLILLANEELQEDLLQLIILQKQKGSLIPNNFINAATELISAYTIDQLKLLLLPAKNIAAPESYIKQIKANIKKMLNKKEPFLGKGLIMEEKKSCVIM